MHRNGLIGMLLMLALAGGYLGGLALQPGFSHSVLAAGGPFKNLASLYSSIRQHHRAPFSHAFAVLHNVPNQAYLQSSSQASQRSSGTRASQSSIRVNQDRNPWNKNDIAAAIDPLNPKHYIIMSNDYRDNVARMFYHVSTNGGQSWSDDSLAPSIDPVTAYAAFDYQLDPGVAFDSAGHSVFSTLTGNDILDGVNNYFNSDTAIEVVTGYNNGTYTSPQAVTIDGQACSGLWSVNYNCPAILDKPLITIDNVAGSPHFGSIYVYYSLYCNDKPCTDGAATVPANSSVIMESHSQGAGFAFSTPALVSGPLTNEQFADMVIDSHGTPHIFFEDFGAGAEVSLYESSLTRSGWRVNQQPLTSLIYAGLNNPAWNFADTDSVAPGCGMRHDTAYCAFAANQVARGPIGSTPSVYLATIHTLTGQTRISRVNQDALNNGKDHFFPWASVGPNGNVYVGWYDNQRDPYNTRIDYRVARSRDGGVSFPLQQVMNPRPFNPCVGNSTCAYFGDYTQLTTGTDGITHATWTDTRDDAGQQLYTRAIAW